MSSTSLQIARPSSLLVGLLLAFVSPFAGAASQATAQQTLPTGVISGRVLDAATGAPLSDVAIQVVGTGVEINAINLGAQTGIDGRFRIRNVRAGTVTLHVRRIGYQPKTITGLYLEADKTIEQDITLSQTATVLDAVTTTIDRERASVRAALEAQRNAPGITNAITSEEIKRSPDSDAASAVQRTGGVVLQDGKFANVRGAGTRLTQTAVDGARVPSPEPELKVVPLDLFPTSLIEAITTSKTFTPDQPGDFGGATIDIRMRDFPGAREVTYSLGTGVNAAMRRDGIPTAPGAGGEGFAFAGRNRSMPSIVKTAGDLSRTTQPERNEIINSFRNVWQPGGTPPLLNRSMGGSIGGNDSVFGRRFGYLASATYSLAQEARFDDSRALARQGNAVGVTEEYNAFTGTSGTSSVLMGGLLKVSTMLGSRSSMSLSSNYNRTADNEARIERGLYEDINLPISIERLSYVERSVFSTQLKGEHDRGLSRILWAASASAVSRLQPDKSDYAYEIQTDGAGQEHRLWLSGLPEAAVRTFSSLWERAYEGSASYQRDIGWGARPRLLKFGVLGRTVARTADTRAFGMYAFAMPDSIRALAPEVLFGGRFTAPDSSMITVRSLSQGGSYEASDWLGATYAMFDGAVSERWRIITGARAEYSNVSVDAINTIGSPSYSRRNFVDVLPALAATFTPSEDHNVRFSITRTLARPEYRELAGIRTRDVIGGVDLRGNPDLIRTLIDNADVRWEWYPTRGELLSVGVFGKRFHNPIERVFQASNTNSILEAANAESATDLGVELEGRANLGRVAAALEPLTVFTNVTVMRSEIRLGDATATSTNAKRAMAGQAPYVVNAGITYLSRDGAKSATVLFNTIGERIANPGELPLPDVVELPRSLLDLSLRHPLGSRFALRFDAKNLLDSPMEMRQGSVVRQFYRTGRVFQTGISWSK